MPPTSGETRFFDAIDWTRPWLKPLLPIANPIIHSRDWRQAINLAAESARLRNHQDLPVHFVPQAMLPHHVPYESFISATGAVPTRENAHDFLNALIWLSFPQIKSRLNALQTAEIAKTDPAARNIAGQGRGKLRDAVTIFDENAALLLVEEKSLLDALRAHQWHEVFVARRTVFERNCEVWLFGHALIEKLVVPYKAITAHAWPVIVNEAFFTLPEQDKRAWVDTTISEQLCNGLE